MPASIAVSSWSLHRTLGQPVAQGAFPWGGMPAHQPDGLDLLELPAALAERGYHQLQLCHFHIPSREPDYLSALRHALDTAGIALDAILLDTGDLTSPTDGDDVTSWATSWLHDAAALGARRMRVIAGRQAPTADTIQTSAARLRQLAAATPDVRVVTENWYELLPNPTHVTQLLEQAGDTVGFLIDLGNWTGESKYDALRAVAPRAETCHAKAHTHPNGSLDTDDYRASLQILADSGFDGTLTLVHDGPTIPEWEALDQEHAIIHTLFPA